MIRGLFYFIFVVFTSGQLMAATTLPHQLTPDDQHKAAEILGLGSMMKLLSSPYPLGGYDGLELGFSSEYIPLKEVAKLGSTTNDRGEFNFYTLSIGKGLYDNIDIYLEFTPLPQGEGLSNYGGQLRWGFYEASFFPVSFSFVLTGGGSSYSSLINSNTIGADFVAVVNLKDVGIYAGLGRARTSTDFVGGVNGITAPEANGNAISHQVDLTEAHELIGVHVKIDDFFIALEADRYNETSLGARVGMRF